MRSSFASVPRFPSDATVPLSPEQTDNNVQRYQQFIETKLKVHLKQTLDQRDAVYTKLAQYVELSKNLTLIKSSSLSKLKTQVNIGSDFYLQAVIPDCSLVTVEIGLGFFVELQLDEAISFISDKQQQLEKQVESYSKKAAVISSQIKMIYEGIAELLRLQETQRVEHSEFSFR